MQIKLKNGRVQRYPDAIGKVLVARGIGEEAKAASTYQTRMLTAAVPVMPAANTEAPYGYKADGSPRKRPGRAPAVKKTGEEE